MRKSLLFIFSILTVCQSLKAQDYETVDIVSTESDSTALVVESPKDSVVNRKVEAAFGIQLDYGKIATLLSDFERKFEAGVSYRFSNRITPNIHFGFGRLNPGIAFKNGTYESSGYYARFGLDYYIPFKQVNAFYVGGKYAFAMFEEKGTYTIESDLWPTFEGSFNRTDLKANWFELVFGSEKKMRDKPIAIGGYLSIRILQSREKFQPIDSHAIPGYGRTFDKSVPAINLYIKYTL